jgi:hypothetical protein
MELSKIFYVVVFGYSAVEPRAEPRPVCDWLLLSEARASLLVRRLLAWYFPAPKNPAVSPLAATSPSAETPEGAVAGTPEHPF